MLSSHKAAWLFACLSIIFHGRVRAADWPCWRGPTHDGISAESRLDWNWPGTGPRILWRAEVGRGSSAFAVEKGRAYTLGNENGEDVIRCLDGASGKTLWAFRYACDPLPLSYEGGPSSTPAIHDGKIYTLSKYGHAHCLNAADGKLAWSYRFETPATNSNDYRAWWGFAGSPVIAGRQAVFAVGPSAAALDAATGKVIWNNGPGRPGYSTPSAFLWKGKPAMAFVAGHEVAAFLQESGAPLWRLPWKTTWDMNASDVVPTESGLFVSSGHGMGCALFDLSGEEPKELWRNKSLRTEYSTALRWKGALVGFDARKLACLDEKSGDVRWKSEDIDFGTIMMADGKWVAQLEKGGLLVVEADTAEYKPVARAEIFSNRSWTVPVLSDARLYLRNARGEAACLDLSPR